MYRLVSRLMRQLEEALDRGEENPVLKGVMHGEDFLELSLQIHDELHSRGFTYCDTGMCCEHGFQIVTVHAMKTERQLAKAA